MTSPWEEPQWNESPSQSNCPDSRGIERNEDQLELFEILSPARIGIMQPCVPRSDSSVEAASASGPVKADPNSVNAGPVNPDFSHYQQTGGHSTRQSGART
jgi:hypothetical protein